MKKLLWLFLFFVSNIASAQIKDTTEALALAKRCKNFDETKADSLLIYSQQIATFSQKNNFKQGISDAIRFKGMHYEYAGKYDTAIQYYLQNLEYAQKNLPPQKATALYSDLMAVYKITKQFDKAKDYGLQMLHASEMINDTPRISSACLNLGVIYRNLEKNDSAFTFYNRALLLKEKLNDSLGLANLRINLSAYYINQKRFAEALKTILPNIPYHIARNEPGDLWFDYTDAASSLIGLNNFEDAQLYLDKAMPLADTTNKEKQSETYEILAELNYKKGDYKKAFEYKEKTIDLERVLLNENTERLMAEANEKFETEKKEHQNQLLTTQLEKNRLQKRNVTIMALAAVLLAIFIGWGLWQKQKANRKLEEKNEIINKQVDKLGELNSEKNSLISIVSHDLASPFGNISVWSQVLQRKTDNLDERQKEAIHHISNSAEQGQRLIHSILTIEKAETGTHKLQLENIDLKILLEKISNENQPLAQNKQLHLQYDAPVNSVIILSDRQLLTRIVENLLSNAIKYSPAGKNIWLSLQEEKEQVLVKIKDEGVGIVKDELKNLFTKYSHLSGKPTAGEESTGLGLSIVKRLVDELNGKIVVESEPGKGSVFTVAFKK